MNDRPRSGGFTRVVQVSRGALRATSGFLRRRYWLVPVLAAAVLFGVGWLVSGLVRDAIRQRLREELTTLVNADITALQEWLRFQKAEAESLAATPTVRDAVRTLDALADDPDRLRR